MVHGLFGGVPAATLTVAAVIEEQNIEPGIMERLCGRQGGAHGAILVVEHEYRRIGGEIAGDPPSAELWMPGGIVAEADGFELEVLGGWGWAEGAGRVQHQLPLGFGKQHADRDVGAEHANGQNAA